MEEPSSRAASIQAAVDFRLSALRTVGRFRVHDATGSVWAFCMSDQVVERRLQVAVRPNPTAVTSDTASAPAAASCRHSSIMSRMFFPFLQPRPRTTQDSNLGKALAPETIYVHRALRVKLDAKHSILDLQYFNDFSNDGRYSGLYSVYFTFDPD